MACHPLQPYVATMQENYVMLTRVVCEMEWIAADIASYNQSGAKNRTD